jgi:DNA-binding IclR family transcriptional regulator
MSGTVDKALRVLEYVMAARGRSVTPSELASALEFNAPTCVRLVNSWVVRGYLMRKSRREGYVPGPAVFSFADNGSFYARLGAAAVAPVREIACEVKRLVLVSTYCAGNKFILRHFDGARNSSSVLEKSYNDLYDTTSGRMLLSRLSESELSSHVKANGLPGKLWDDIDSRERLEGELQEIRSLDHYCFNDQEQYVGVAVGLEIEGQPFAVLSSSVPAEKDVSSLLILLRSGAECIRRSLDVKRAPIAY